MYLKNALCENHYIFKSFPLSLFIILSLTVFLSACRSDKSPAFFHLRGKTMGTTYSIKYLDSLQRNFGNHVDSVLIAVNLSMSTYIDSSLISRFNAVQDTNWFEVDSLFAEVFKISKKVFEISNGSFDPTVMPLVNVWGFGPQKNIVPDSTLIDSLLILTGFSKIMFKETSFNKNEIKYFIKKENPWMALDFSAVAKGFGVDVVAALLESKGIGNYMVEIGGEVRAKGKNARNVFWSIGIDKPVEEGERKIQTVIFLENQSLATSGNYRNFYLKDGKKYVHTINPLTGYPEINNTLSVSVIADNCALADALATACMVMGVDRAQAMMNEITDAAAYFIYAGDNENFETLATGDFSKKVKSERSQ